MNDVPKMISYAQMTCNFIVHVPRALVSLRCYVEIYSLSNEKKKKRKLPFGKTVSSFVRQMNCHASRMTSGYIKLRETTFEHAKCEHVTELNLQEPVVGSFPQCTIQSSCLKKSCSRVKMKTKKPPLCAQGG